MRRAAGMAAAFVLLGSGLAACGGSSDSGSKAGSGKTVNSSSFINKISTNYVSNPPTDGPKPAAKKSVWWMSCGETIPDCKTLSSAAGEAAKKLGWDFHIGDGKLNVAGGWATAVRTALAAKPDAIITQGMACSLLEQPLKEAKAQGVKVLGIQSYDCNESDPSAPSLYSAKMLYGDKAQTIQQFYEAWGRNAAEYIIGATKGKARIINNSGFGSNYTSLDKGFNDAIKTCSGCKVIQDIRFIDADMGPTGPWITKFRVALAKNPTANATFFPFDNFITTNGGAQAIKESGLKMVSVGGTGSQPDTVDEVRKGNLTAITAAQSLQWTSYAAMDNLNRIFNGQPTVPEGVGPSVLDKTHNMPPAGQAFQSPINWKAAYDKLWSK